MIKILEENQNGKNLRDDKEVILTCKLMAYAGHIRTIIEAEWYRARTGQKTTLHCSVWFLDPYMSGYARVGGNGYMLNGIKQGELKSTAFFAAVKSAGIETDIGQGVSTMDEIETFLRAYGEQRNYKNLMVVW